MRIVLDTNVVVSGLLSPFGTPAEIVRMAIGGILEVCYDARIISEYRAVLKRPQFGLDAFSVEIIVDQIESAGHLAIADPLPYRLPDSGDEPFLEVAIAANVDFLVTGNTKHYPVKKRHQTKVVTPSQFIQMYRKIQQ